MKKLALMFLFSMALLSCKKEENTTTETTVEKTKVDTVNGQVQKRTTVQHTTETDSTKATITSGKVEKEPAE